MAAPAGGFIDTRDNRMILNDTHESRRNPRSIVHGHVEVNGGNPFRGGTLHDMSVGGASVTYPDGQEPNDDPVKVGDEILLVIRGRAHMPGRVVRLFEGGFAVEFDWSLEIDRDRFMGYRLR